MKLRRIFVCGVAGIVLAGARIFAADNTPTNPVMTTPPVFVPAVPQPPKAMPGQLPTSVVVWDRTTIETNVAANTPMVHFVFNFTNVSSGNVTVVNVHPQCGCTTTELPPLPWTVAPGTNGVIRATVNVAGKSGFLIKTMDFATDKGFQLLTFKITILPPVTPTRSEAERVHDVEIAKADRQAVFQGECVKCHVTPGTGKYNKALYAADCAICHEGEHRATMVPDLHAIKTPTNVEFWRTWTAHGKPNSLMPAFSTAEDGPLNDMQIASIAAYLAEAIPSQVPQTP
jgi:mono/diheme cytochrome c family protein